MPSKPFDPAHYSDIPGVFCSCCRRPFEPGEPVIERDVAEDWSTPTCAQCDAFDVPLVADHPFGPGKTHPIACADGMVR